MELKVGISLKGAIWSGKAPQIVQDGLAAVMYEAVALLEREVKKITPTGVYGAKGGLKSTVHGEVVGKGTPMLKGIVAHGSAYGDVVEKGRTAGKKMPPEGVLLRWIEVKMGLPEVEAKRLEFVIRRKIGQKGFPGAAMFGNALENSWPKLRGMFDRAGFEITKNLNS